MTTRNITFRDTKVEKSAKLDVDGDSVISFASGPITHKPLIKFAWSANDKINHETFHRMLEEYREAKRRELDLDLKAKQLAAQLARTEEAAKRALLQTDATAKGGAAQKLLDAERAVSKLRDENAELRNKLSREKKKSADEKSAHVETKRRLEAALRDQRAMSKRLGELERKNSMLMRKPEDEFWGEEAGRRFVIQQEELVALREENLELRKQQEALDAGISGDSSHLESQLQELTALVKFYEKKISTLAEQQVIFPQDDVPGGPNSGDWILEEHIHKDEMFLLDRKTGKLYTNPGEGTWPKPVGIRTGTEVKLGSESKMERFLDTLDHYLQSQGERLRETFNEFDLDNSGFLDRRELARLIQKLMPDAQARDVEELRTMLDVDGDGQITYDELVLTIKEAYAARTAAKMGKNIQVNDTLERIRDVLKNNRKVVREAFDELDSDHDGCLYHMEVVRLMRRFLPDMYQKEVRFLLGKLQEWDVTGEGKCTYEELYQAVELATLYRVGQGMAGMARPASPSRFGRAVSPGRPPGGGPGAAAMSMTLLRQSAGQGLKDAFLRERVDTLEAELKAAQEKQNLLEAEAKQVGELRRDLTTYKVRIEELHKDLMRIDVINQLGNADGAGIDDKLKQAWETASMFKKRYMEHKAELDGIKVTYARMQAQLEETHRLLNDEHRRRFHLEDQLSHANMELQRVKDLEARLQQERVQRVKLEREFLELQNRAFNAPTQQLVELRQLQTEVFALRREKVLAEQNENAVRQELSRVREQLDGMSLEHYRAWQRDHDALKRRIVELELELQAALDKLEVYRRTQPPGVSDVLLGGEERGSLFGDNRPDADKSAEELRLELAQLRDVWRVDRDELKKLHQVLEIEENKCMEARAALEEAHREMDRLRRDFQDQIRALQRELELRDERIRRLELQLRGAYMGVNNAIRSGLRDSTITDPDDMSDIGEMQNLLELHISEASVFEEVVGKEPPVFFTVDFFMHETQATQVVASNTPSFNTVVQFVVEQEPFLIEYLDTHVLELELNRARGWDYDPVGVARVPLRQLLDDVDIGAALGHNVAWHHVDVFGADNRRIGRVRYGFRFRKPLDSLVKQYRDFERSKRPSEPDPRDPAFVAVQTASLQPKSSSYVKVVVVACRNLVPPTRHAVRPCRPYVHYRFPGHRDPHTTKVLHGLSPDYHDEATWLIARSTELDASFRTREMHFLVFDDSAGDDPQRGIIGLAVVPLSELSRGMPVEGSFRIINPITREESGQIILGMGWHNPLRLPGEAPAPPGDDLRSLLARGPQEVPARMTADSDLSLRGFVNPQGAGVGFGLGAETRNVPRDEFGEPLRPAYGSQRQHGLEAEVGRVDAGRRAGYGGEEHGLAAEVQGGGRGGAGGARAGHGLEAEVSRAGFGDGTRGGAGGVGVRAGHGLEAEVSRVGAGDGARGGVGGPRAGHGLEAEVSRARVGEGGIGGSGNGRRGLDGGGQGFGLAQDVDQQPRRLGGGERGPGAGGAQHGLAADLGLEPSRGTAQGQRQPFGLGAEGLEDDSGGGRGGGGAGVTGAGGRALGLSQSRAGSRRGEGGGVASFGLAADADDDDDDDDAPPGGDAAGSRRGLPGSRAGGLGGGSSGISRAGSGRTGRDAPSGGGGGGGFGLSSEAERDPPISRGASGRFASGPRPLGEAVEWGDDDEEDGAVWTSPLLPLPGSMLLSGSGSQMARQGHGSQEGRKAPQRYSNGGLSPAVHQPPPPSQQQGSASGSVLVRVPSDTRQWPTLSSHIILSLESLELTSLALSDASLQSLFLMHAFLEVPDLEATCTSPPHARRPGKLQLDYTVAYTVDERSLASRRAVAELIDKLTGSEGAFLDIRLFSAPAAPTGLANRRAGGAARAVASCEIPLAGLWSGRHQDLMGRRLALLGDEGMGAAAGLVLGHVTVTLRAADALAGLRQVHGP